MNERGSRCVDTVIVGGGIAGTALAYYLAQAGAEGIMLIERDQLGSGATCESFSGVRQQFSTPFEIELSKRGLRFWKTCEEQFDSPCPFNECGYLLITSNQEMMLKLVESAILQRKSEAGPVELLTPADLRSVAPWMTTDDLIGGSYTPKDGRVTGTDGVAALAKGARRYGAEIRQWSPVKAIERRNSHYRIIGENFTLTARRVVIAAGIETPTLLSPLGLRVDIVPVPMHYAITTSAPEGRTVPLTIDLDTGFCVEPDGQGLAVSMVFSEAPLSYSQHQMLEDWYVAATSRAPMLVNLGISHVISALVDEVSDGHPNAGRLEEELWVLAGFAGHGVMHGPVLAELLAREMLGNADGTVDLDICNPLRISQSKPQVEWMTFPPIIGRLS